MSYINFLYQLFLQADSCQYNMGQWGLLQKSCGLLLTMNISWVLMAWCGFDIWLYLEMDEWISKANRVVSTWVDTVHLYSSCICFNSLHTFESAFLNSSTCNFCLESTGQLTDPDIAALTEHKHRTPVRLCWRGEKSWVFYSEWKVKRKAYGAADGWFCSEFQFYITAVSNNALLTPAY